MDLEDEGFEEEDVIFGLKKPNDATETCKGKLCLEPFFEGTILKGSKTFPVVKWEEIAKLPPNKVNRHISWDDLKYPYPYRSYNFDDNVKNRKILETQAFISDDTRIASEIVDNIWKIPTKRTCSDSGEETAFQFPELVQQFVDANLRPKYISLRQFIDNLLHLLCGRESQSFSLVVRGPDDIPGENGDANIETIAFVANVNVMVHGIHPITLKNFSQPFLECGSMYKRLRLLTLTSDYGSTSFSKMDERRREFFKKFKGSAVFQAFLDFIIGYLKSYQTLVMVKRDGIVTLSQLNAFMKPLKCQLSTLEEIVDLEINDNVVQFLATLNNLLFMEENQSNVGLLRNLFSKCASAYLRYIADWVFRGELGPPNEFHIIRSSDTHKGRKFWTRQFLQNENVPEFLKNTADKIFETGKTLNLLLTLEPVFSSLTSSPLFAATLGEDLEAQLCFDQLRKLSEKWSNKLKVFATENSYLNLEIGDAIAAGLPKTPEWDIAAMETERLNFQKRAQLLKLEARQREQEKKQDLLQTLKTQITQAKELKLQKRRSDLVEDAKNKEYLAQKAREYDDEKRLQSQQKHFPRPKSTFDIDVRDSPEPDVNKRVVRPRALTQSISEPASLSKVAHQNGYHTEANKEIRNSGGDCGNKSLDKCTPNVKDCSEVELEGKESKVDEEVEIKFDPKKTITRDPTPYKLLSLCDFAKPVQEHDHSDLIHNLAKQTEERRFEQCCMNEFLGCSVFIPVIVQNKMVNSVLLHHMIKVKMLFRHLEMINNFMCLQNGMFSRFLTELLIDEVQKSPLEMPKDISEKHYRVNMILTEALSIALENDLSDPLLNNLSFVYVAPDPQNAHERSDRAKSEFQCLNYLKLTYSIVWPLNIILSSEMMSIFQDISSLLLRIVRAELLLERLFMNLKSKCSKSRQLFQLNFFRFRMLHFVRSMRNYISLTVLHSSWNEISHGLQKSDSLEKIYDHLVFHVKNISSNCLLGVKGGRALKFVISHLVVVESFCSQLHGILTNHEIQWEAGEEIPQIKFNELWQKFEVTEEYAKIFSECVLKLSLKRIYPKVDNFLEHYNFNGFFQTVLLS